MRRQHGMVSIMVTMLMMIVISLVVLGFAQVSRSEQTESFNTELALQASLAAETGVNDFRSMLATLTADPGWDGNVPEKTNCGPTTDYPTTKLNPVVQVDDNVTYPCILISTKLQTLQADVSPDGTSVKLPVQTDGQIDHLRFNWKSSDRVTSSDLSRCNSVAPNFKKVSGNGAWDCPYGVLRVEFVTVPHGAVDRDALDGGRVIFFLYPTANGSMGVASVGSVDHTVQNAGCNASGGCTFQLNGLDDGNNYAVKISALYNSSTFSIAGYDGSDDQQILENGQILVDVTGDAQGVLRRIQARLPLTGDSSAPEYALATAGSICKRYQYNTSGFTIANNLNNQDQTNPMCRTLSVSTQ